MDNVQGGGVLVKNPVSAPGPPPPFKNPGSAPAREAHISSVVCCDSCAIWGNRKVSDH